MTRTEKKKMQEIALETAQRLIDYGYYSKKESKAISAMKRRFPGLSREVYQRYLNDAMAVHHDAIKYVDSNRDTFYEALMQKPPQHSLLEIADNFVGRYSSYRVNQLITTLIFVFFECHLKNRNSEQGSQSP